MAKQYLYIVYEKSIIIPRGENEMDKGMRKTYATPELKKIGTVNELTKGETPPYQDQISGADFV